MSLVRREEYVDGLLLMKMMILYCFLSHHVAMERFGWVEHGQEKSDNTQ